MELETLARCDLCASDQLKVFDTESNMCACLSCGYVFDNPRPTAEDIARFYSKAGKYDSWIQDERGRDWMWKRRLQKMLRTRKPGSLLDIGTGIGQFLHHARAFYSNVYGTEVSTTAIDVAKKKYNLVVRQGEIESLQFPEAPFDNISLFHVLEHVPSPKSVIHRCRQLLSEGGILVIAVPNEVQPLRIEIKLLLKRMGLRTYRYHGKSGIPRITLNGGLEEIHLSHFTHDSLKKLLESSGFSILENTLDPFYSATDVKRVIVNLYYVVSSLLWSALGINLYAAIWMVARKNTLRGSHIRLLT